MEIGLLQTVAARRLTVFHSIVQRLYNQYQYDDSLYRRHVPGQPRTTTLAEDRYPRLSAQRRRHITVPHIITVNFVASGTRIFDTTVRRLFTMHSSMQNDQPCMSLLTDNNVEPTYVGKKNTFTDQTEIGLSTPHRRLKIHTRELFRASANTEETTHQIPSIQGS